MRTLICFTVALAACGGVGINDFESKLVDAYCKNAVTCKMMPDVATCKAATSFKTRQFETLIAKSKTKVIKYDDGKGADCIDSVETQTCTFDGFHTAPSPCVDAFAGTVAAGGACAIDNECAGGGTCVPTDMTCDSRTACCPGTCKAAVPDVAIGGDCAAANCVSTAYCASATHTCTALITTAGTACKDIDACSDPMYCDILQASPTCIAPAAEGATCDPMLLLPCADNRDYCDETTKKCTLRLAIGGACEGANGALCVGYATCTSMTCAARVTAGGACTLDMQGFSNCLGDLDCKTNACTLPPAEAACRVGDTSLPSPVPSPAPVSARKQRPGPFDWLNASRASLSAP